MARKRGTDGVAEAKKAARKNLPPRSYTVEMRDPATLKPHPLNATIYGDGADDQLTDDVTEWGVQTPIFVTRPDAAVPSVIVSGHRRVAAAVAAGVDEVPVIVRHDLMSDADILAALLSMNKQRQKTGDQIAREFKLAKTIVEMRWAEKTDVAGETAPVRPTARVEDQAADIVGVSRTTARRAEAVADAAQELQAVAPEDAKAVADALHKSPGAGERELKKVIQRRAAEDDETDAAASEAGLRRDVNGTPIPRSLRVVLDAAPVFKAARRKLLSMIKEFEDMNTRAASRLNLTELRSELTNAANCLEDAAPYCVCNQCGGSGQWQGTGCGGCEGEGWMTGLGFRATQSADDRAAAKTSRKQKDAADAAKNEHAPDEGADAPLPILDDGHNPNAPGLHVPTEPDCDVPEFEREPSGECAASPVEAARSLVAGAFAGVGSGAIPDGGSKPKPKGKKKNTRKR